MKKNKKQKTEWMSAALVYFGNGDGLPLLPVILCNFVHILFPLSLLYVGW